MEHQGSGTETLEKLWQNEPTDEVGYRSNSASQANKMALIKAAESAENDLLKKSDVKVDKEAAGELRRWTTELNMDESPIKVGDKKLETQDPLIEVNLGSDEDKRLTYITKPTWSTATSGLGDRALSTELRPFLAPPRRLRANLKSPKITWGENYVHSPSGYGHPRKKLDPPGPKEALQPYPYHLPLALKVSSTLIKLSTRLRLESIIRGIPRKAGLEVKNVSEAPQP
uniref:Uncharacterized protein n=1 Tax=Ananas comosus var. bracteatus TaxID=296719 RepID=A0A6V7Q2M4_ANACO|nr:unnamed protein product [Ananas comosus var. bracteatus]